MTDTNKLERYIPEHPLPEEVRKMERDETVCKYCGVSYLIHNEIKALEDKLKKTQEELEHYKGCELREETLNNKLIIKDKNIEDLNRLIQGKDEALRTLQDDLRSKDEDITKIQNLRKKVDSALAHCTQQLEKYKLKHEFLMRNLPSVQQQLKQIQSSMQSVKQDESTHRQILTQYRKHLENTVAELCSKHQRELVDLKDRVISLDNERLSFKAKEKSYIHDIASYEAQLQKTQSQNTNELVQLQQKFDQLWAESTEMQSEIRQLQEKLKLKDLDLVQYREQMSSQSQNAENLQNQLKQRDMAAEQSAIKQLKELKEKENELETVVRELGRMKKKFKEQQEDVEKKHSMSNMKSSEMKEQLVRSRADLEALKSEREMMITAHQNQIEQLRESFKNKLAETDKWPEKLEEMLRKERDKHGREMAALEQQFKQNFVMELQIEKQKHQELLDKYKDQNKDGEKELEQKINSIKSQHKSEVSEFHKQLAENKARFRETENSLREEIQSLKKIITDLERRLSRLDGGEDSKSSQYKYEMKKVESELNEAKERNKKLEAQVSAVREEIGFLQETVRRECEERFELTEALSVAKEELLALKKPVGGYGSRVSSNAPCSPESARTVNSEEVALFKKVSRVPQPPAQCKELNSASSVTLGYEGHESAPRNHKAHRASSISSSRERIAQAVGRK